MEVVAGWLFEVEHIWSKTWLGYWLVTISFCVFGWFHWHLPPSGYAVVGMAVVAGIMAIRPKMGGWERSLWLVVLACFAIIEIRAINHDRTKQNEDFKTIAGGLTTTLNQTMGGSSYPKFIATFPPDPSNKEMSVLVITPGQSWPHGHIPAPEEAAPLPDVTVDVTEWEHHANPSEITMPELESVLHPTHYNLGTLKVPGTFTAPFKLEKGKRYSLQITTRRGEYREDIRIDRDPKAAVGWKESSCVYGRRTIYTDKTVTSQEYLLDGKCD
ncbi:MAG: hypothetical protein WBX03_16685 [Terriglobales bacterium]